MNKPAIILKAGKDESSAEAPKYARQRAIAETKLDAKLIETIVVSREDALLRAFNRLESN